MYDDYELTFKELLEKHGSFTDHHYNTQMLYIELYEVYHNLSQTFFSNLSRRNSNFAFLQVRVVLKG